MALTIESYSFQFSQKASELLLAAAGRVLVPAGANLVIVPELISGELTAWLRKKNEYNGGYKVQIPEGLVVVQDFCNDDLAPSYNSEYSGGHFVATHAEVASVIRESVAKRREFANKILARAKALEEMADNFAPPSQPEEDW